MAWLKKIDHFWLIPLLLIVIPLYPKFPLSSVSGSFVAIRLEDIVIAIVTIYMIFYWLTNRFKSFFLPVQRSILLYLFAGFVSALSGILLLKSIPVNIGLLHTFRRVEYMVLFFISFDLLKNVSQLKFAIRTLLIVSALVALYGLGQQYLGLPVISTNNSEFSKGLALSLGPGARINSTFAGHYDLAAFSLIPLLLILGLVAANIKNTPLLLLAAPIYYAMCLSASRVAFASFFLAAGLFLITLKKYLWVAPLTILLIVSVIATPQLSGRYRELILDHLFSYVPVVSAQASMSAQEEADALKPAATPEDRSLNIRLKAEWPRALRAFYKNPLLGTGFSSIGLASDNDYLRMLAETGILGTAAFFLIIYRIFKTSLKYAGRSPKTISDIFILSISFSFFGLLLNAVFIDVFEASKIAIIIWILLGLSQKAKVLNTNHEN